jgi:hypothetical protein
MSILELSRRIDTKKAHHFLSSLLIALVVLAVLAFLALYIVAWTSPDNSSSFEHYLRSTATSVLAELENAGEEIAGGLRGHEDDRLSRGGSRRPSSTTQGDDDADVSDQEYQTLDNSFGSAFDEDCTKARHQQIVNFANRRLREWASHGLDVTNGQSLRVQALMKALSSQTLEEYIQCNDPAVLRERVSKKEIKLHLDGVEKDIEDKKSVYVLLSDPGADVEAKKSRFKVKPRMVRVVRLCRLKITAGTTDGEKVLVSRDKDTKRVPQLTRRGPRGSRLVVMKVAIGQTNKSYNMQQALSNILNLDTDWQQRNLIDINCHDVDLEITPPIEGEDICCWVLLYNMDMRIKDDASIDDLIGLGLPEGKTFNSKVFGGSSYFTADTSWGWLAEDVVVSQTHSGPEAAAGPPVPKTGAQARPNQAESRHGHARLP